MMGIFDDIPIEGKPSAAAAGLFDDIPIDAPMLADTALGARGAAEDAGGQRQTAHTVGGLEYVTGIAQKAVQGLTANWGDEVAATLGAVGAKLPYIGSGKSRAEILREIRGDEERFAEQNPKTALGAEIGGALTGGISGGAALARAVPWLMRASGVTGTALRTGLASIPGGAADRVGRMEGEHGIADMALEAGKGASIAGGLGAVTGGGGRALGNVVGPWLSPVAERLHRLGVRLTPGEMIGGYAKRAEDAATSAPFAGHMVRNRQAEGTESINRTAYDQALAPVTETAPAVHIHPDTETGHEAMQEMADLLGQRFQTVVPQMSAHFDQPLANEIRRISGSLPQTIRPEYADAFRRHMQDLLDLNTGMFSGEALQTAFQGLRREARNIRASRPTAYESRLADALTQTQHALETAAGRVTPAAVMDDFNRLNSAYANFTVLRDAAGRTGSDMGIFNPANLHASVRQADRSAGKGAMSRGTARMQDVSGPAKSVMTRRVSDSGTPERTALIAAILTPTLALKAVPALGGLAALYSRTGNRAFQRLGTAGLDTRAALKRAINAASMPGGVAIGQSGVGVTGTSNNQ